VGGAVGGGRSFVWQTANVEAEVFLAAFHDFFTRHLLTFFDSFRVIFLWNFTQKIVFDLNITPNFLRSFLFCL